MAGAQGAHHCMATRSAFIRGSLNSEEMVPSSETSEPSTRRAVCRSSSLTTRELLLVGSSEKAVPSADDSTRGNDGTSIGNQGGKLE